MPYNVVAWIVYSACIKFMSISNLPHIAQQNFKPNLLDLLYDIKKLYIKNYEIWIIIFYKLPNNSFNIVDFFN